VLEAKVEKQQKDHLSKIDEIYELENKLKSDLNLQKIEELNDLIKTKNMILDDQTHQILDSKHQLQAKDDEIGKCDEKISKIRSKFEKKNSLIQKENTDLNLTIEQLKEALGKYENDFSQLQYELERLGADNAELVGKIEERDERINLFKTEFGEIKKINESNHKQVIVRDEQILLLKDSIEELNKSLLDMNEERKEIIMHFDGYKAQKNSEVEAVLKENQELKNDIKVVIEDYEKLKKKLKDYGRILINDF